MISAATTTVTGITIRSNRTHRLWRRAARNTRASLARSRGAWARVARSSTWVASACDATVKRVPHGPSRNGSGGSDCLTILSKSNGTIANKCGSAAAYPLEFPCGSLRPRSGLVHHARLRKHSGMRKDILGGPACEIKPHPIGQEPEAGLRQGRAALARQHTVELGLERVQDAGRRRPRRPPARR